QRAVKNTLTLEQRVEDQTRALKEMQSQLMQVSKLSALGTMSASLAHELNNPIAVMTGYLETLKESNLPEEPARQIVRIEESLKRMQQTIDHLRRFSRRGKGAEFWRLTDLSQIVADSFILLDPVIEASKISVRMELAEESLPILGDSHLLESVVQ